ncbi:transglutaminase domain-containing protein [Immundisolibacter sp.]|uniref:transglutaminase domain-containing protein n=1 Tax=Immundisolibacter sp. TaxID=1934948 RepID=UPI0026129ABD|nr:transglutaminase domain-containing protein [Immundisolibacter sp.]MDD3650669.1 transglutaminase domain-containing protein [Immundisolibacter sp.]
MRAADGLLAVAVAAAGAHVLLSMQVTMPALVFAVSALLAPLPAWLRWRRPLAPTAGLAFITCVSGGLLGYMALADWLPAGSWAADFTVFGGLCLAVLVLALWLLLTRPAPLPGRAGDRVGDALAATVLLLALLIPRRLPAAGLVAALPWLAVGAALLAPATARLGARALRRALLLAPLLVLLPLAEAALRAGQRPLLGALFHALPAPRGAAGFAPLAQLQADGLLHPARRPVLRVFVRAGTPPPYLVGNRLLTLDAQYAWQTVDAGGAPPVREADGTGARYRLAAGRPSWTVELRSLRRDDLLFLPPGTYRVELAEGELGVDAAGVLQGRFSGRSARRWQAIGGPPPAGPPAPAAALALPPFWDGRLQAAAAALAGPDAAHTAARIGAELRARRYSLHYRLDRQAPLHDFFLNRRPAHCFWYATAAALALRANGVPSRLVTGYRVSEPLGGGAFLVRERDAHAWAEWQDAAGRWHTLDATPADYDAALAGYGGGALERAWQRLAARLDAWWAQVELTDAQVRAVLLAGLAALAGLFVREYRRLRQAPPTPGHARQWQRLWRRFLRLSGLPERAQWTASDYLAQLPDGWPPARRAAARRFLECYARTRFAPGASPAQAAAALRELRRQRLKTR